MPTNYDSIIDKLSDDPDFLNLPQEDQDQLIQELAQETMGTIPKTEGVLQRAIQKQGGLRNSAVNMAVGGLPSAVNPQTRPEDALPMVAQAGTDYAFNLSPQGRVLGVIPGMKYGATVGATTLAEGARQGAKALRGEGGSLEEIGKTALGTAGIEGLFRGANQALFKSQIGKELISGANKRIGEMVGGMTEKAKSIPNLTVMRDDLLGFLDNALKDVAPIGPQATALKKMRKFISGMKDQLNPQDLQNLKNNFGDIAEFRPEKAGQIKNKVANIASKEARGRIGATLSDIGDITDIPYRQANKEASLAQKFYGASQKAGGIKDIIGKAITSSAIGGTVGYQQKDPMAGLGAGLMSMIGQSKGLRDILYNAVVKSGASKAGRIALSEKVREED